MIAKTVIARSHRASKDTRLSTPYGDAAIQEPFGALRGAVIQIRAEQKAGFARRPNAHALLNAAGDVMLRMAAYAVIAAIASSRRDRAMVEA